MKVIIAGNRSLGRRIAEVERAMRDAEAELGIIPTEVICGMAPGADLLGKQWAEERDIPVRAFPAEWDLHGRSAGPIRNGKMAAVADALVAVWDGESSGTKDMIRQARRKGLTIHIHYFRHEPRRTAPADQVVFDFDE